ncbi:MAG: phosphotransferase, partial [Chitinophagaceae bacterium]|nr:phosphotransferase [Chitinophagaceae bacterium]
NNDKSIYFQEDVGVVSLLEKKILLGECDEVKKNYQDALLHLIDIQFIFQSRDFENEFKKLNSFDEERIKNDLIYFKTYFLLQTGIQFDEKRLEIEFDEISNTILDKNLIVFMYRDFQGRNIMVNNNKIYFIDFQGAMQGSPMYDVASLLWQAKACLSKEWKRELLDFYIFHLKNRIEIDEEAIKKSYQKIVLLRLLQVMGAYGLRGLVEKKEHFISSIPSGIKNIIEWKEENSLAQYPELNHCLEQLKNYKIEI